MSNFINIDASRMQNNAQTSQTAQIQDPNKSDVDAFTTALNESPSKNSTQLQTESFKKAEPSALLTERSFSIKTDKSADRSTLDRSVSTSSVSSTEPTKSPISTSSPTASPTSTISAEQGKSADRSILDRSAFSSTEQNTIASGQNPFAHMTNPLDSLYGNVMTTKEVAQTPHQNMSTMNEKIVETILVSQPDADNQEVRITLGKDVLPGTEVRITRDIHGTLNIILQTNNPSSFQTLVAGQQDLKAMLEQSEGDIKITVESGDAEQNDTNQRSRGYDEYNTEDE